MLYELLSGHLPHRFRRETPAEIERVICEVEPERPSVVAKNRRLAGDLDNIVLTAMRKEQQRRYASVVEFSEDIRRHMEGLPVAAQEDRWTYRAGKFIRRNRLGVATVVLVMISLVAGIIATTVQARRAERRFQLARGLANSMVFDFNDQLERLPGATSARASLVQTVAGYLDSLARDSVSDPELDLEIAAAYSRVAAIEGHPFHANLGQTALSLSHYRKAIDMFERLVLLPATANRATPGVDPLTHRNQRHRGAERQCDGGRAAAAESVGAGGRGVGTRRCGGDAGGVGESILPPGRRRHAARRRRAGPAVSCRRRSTCAASGPLPVSRWRRAACCARRICAWKARSLRAATWLARAGRTRPACRASKSCCGSPIVTLELQYDVILAHHRLGDVLGGADALNLGDREGALRHYRAAAAIGEKMAQSDPHEVRARDELQASYRRIGGILIDSQPKEALEYYRKSFALAETLSEANVANLNSRRDLASSRLAVGEALLRLGQKDEALAQMTAAFEIIQQVVAAAPHQIFWLETLVRAHSDLGEAQLNLGDSAHALEHFQQALATTGKLLDQAPSNLFFQRDRADAFEALGECYVRLSALPGIPPGERTERRALARSQFEKSHAIWQDWLRRKLAVQFAVRREARLAGLLGRFGWR